MSATLLLTSGEVFFEPYLPSGLDVRDRRAMNTLEVCASLDAPLYDVCDSYFEAIWESGISLDAFSNDEDRYKQRFREIVLL